MKKLHKTDVVAEYCQKYKALPSLTLARIIYAENKALYKSLDSCRQAVMYVRGKHGKGGRDKASSKFSGLFDHVERTKVSPYTLPKTWAHEKKIFKLPKAHNRIGFISDPQVPFQDNEAIEVTYEALKKKGINTMFINGDWVDFYGLSNFEKDPRRRDFVYEYHCILQSFEHLRHHFPKIPIYYNLDSNHEIRYEKFMSIKARELMSLELPEYSLETMLKLKYFDITPLKNNYYVQIGKLIVVHGHTLFKGQTSPVSTARTVFMKAGMSTIASHCHQVNEYTTPKINGDLITCWTNGCLMDLNVEYNQHGNKYSHGFAYIETDDDGTFRVENKRIHRGKVL